MSDKILLIDDDPRLVEALQIRLEAAGYGVHVAYNGQDGVATAQQILPQLVILDVNMPGMDGLQVCRTLREADRLSTTPIIIMSAITHQLARRAAPRGRHQFCRQALPGQAGDGSDSRGDRRPPGRVKAQSHDG